MNDTYLAHHGVKGQKWGVRRYRNANGSLTAKGKKHYQNMSGKKVYRSLKKEVQDKRAVENGRASKWGRLEPIGPESKRLIDSYYKNEAAYRKSKDYKDWNKKYESYERSVAKKDVIPRDYDAKINSLLKQRPKKNFEDLSFAKVAGKGYVDNYVNKGGRTLSMAYLKDLGYDDQTSKDFVKKMASSGYTLGDS